MLGWPEPYFHCHRLSRRNRICQRLACYAGHGLCAKVGLASCVAGAAAAGGSGTTGVSSSSNDVIWSLAISRYPVEVKSRVELALCSLWSKWMENPLRRMAIWPAKADICASTRTAVTVNVLENLISERKISILAQLAAESQPQNLARPPGLRRFLRCCRLPSSRSASVHWMHFP